MYGNGRLGFHGMVCNKKMLPSLIFIVHLLINSKMKT
jgi:hypothetical protein